MEEKIVPSPCDITRENLKRISNETGALSELRLFELSDTVASVSPTLRELYDEGLGVYEILSCIEDVFDTEADYGTERVFDRFKGIVGSANKRLGEYDRAALASLLADEFQRLGMGERDFLSSEKRESSFTYVKNILADEAYDVLSEDFTDPRVKYSRDLAECARLVATGDTAYALLPFEERGGTRLNSVSELIWRYDLKINKVTPVFGPDGTADMKYALVSASFSVPEVSEGDDRYLEIRVSQGSDTSPSELLGVFSMLGHSIYRVNTETFRADGEAEGFFSIVIRDDGQDFTPLLVYLTLFVTDYYPVGIYKNLE